MNLIEKKAKQLTKGLGKEKAVIKLHAFVRDLPWRLVPFGDAEHLLKYGFGDCRAKHNLLADFYKTINIPVKYLGMEFDWKDLPIPKNILNQLETIGTVWPHYSIKIKIGNKWIIADATWDSALKKAGFPVNEPWDGKSNAGFITDKVTNISILNPLREHVDMLANLFKVVTHVNEYFLFAEKFNLFLEKQRRR